MGRTPDALEGLGLALLVGEEGGDLELDFLVPVVGLSLAFLSFYPTSEEIDDLPGSGDPRVALGENEPISLALAGAWSARRRTTHS